VFPLVGTDPLIEIAKALQVSEGRVGAWCGGRERQAFQSQTSGAPLLPWRGGCGLEGEQGKPDEQGSARPLAPVLLASPTSPGVV
jgi:hypothetical protein